MAVRVAVARSRTRGRFQSSSGQTRIIQRAAVREAVRLSVMVFPDRSVAVACGCGHSCSGSFRQAYTVAAPGIMSVSWAARRCRRAVSGQARVSLDMASM